MAAVPEPDEGFAPRFTQPEIQAMLRDLRADLADRRREIAELEGSERWLADQLEGTRRVKVTSEQFRAWAQTRPGRFTARSAAGALGGSVDQARKKLRRLAAAGTLAIFRGDSRTSVEEFEFVKPEPVDGPQRRPRGGAPPVGYAPRESSPVPGTGGGSSKGRPTNDKATNEAVAAAVARGWEVNDRGNALALTSPEGERVFVHKTPTGGTSRVARNVRATIRRAERRGRDGRFSRQPALA